MTSGLAAVIDTRSLTKPPRFSGHEGHWKDWSFQFEAYMGLMSPVVLERMAEAVQDTRASMNPLHTLEATIVAESKQ
eukprot:3473897-Amphidinium_carterae.1